MKNSLNLKITKDFRKISLFLISRGKTLALTYLLKNEGVFVWDFRQKKIKNKKIDNNKK